MLNYPDCFAEITEHECRHDSHGYSQPNRAGIGTGGPADETITLSDSTQVKISSGEKDCSSLQIECVAAMGLPTGGATYTGNMRCCLLSTGLFEWHGRDDLGSLKRGDILLNVQHHTACYLGNGLVGMASQSEHGTITGARGDQTGREIYIRSYYDYPWDGFLRYCGPVRTGAVVVPNPTPAPVVPVTSGDLGDMDWFGPLYAKALQSAMGTKVDGILSGQPSVNNKYFWAVSGGVEWVSGTGTSDGSDAILALQRFLKGKGYDPSGLDGDYGTGCITAHQRFLKDRGYYFGQIDGYHGHETNQAMGKALMAGAYK